VPRQPSILLPNEWVQLNNELGNALLYFNVLRVRKRGRVEKINRKTVIIRRIRFFISII
jgi:predicted secreted hydrolase